jgi:inner membrane protein
MFPDLDVIGLWLGVPYEHPLGHRGFSHSIAFGLLLGLVAFPFAQRLNAAPHIVFLFITLSTISHGVLDAMTNGGLGVAFLWPFSDKRFFLPWRPLYVSPTEIGAFLSPRGLRWLTRIVISELVVIWLPAIGVYYFARRKPKSKRADA